MDNATLIFETLLRKGVFMDKVDSYVQSISDNNIIDLKRVPELVFLIITILEPKIEGKLTMEDTYELLTLFMKYIIRVYNKEDMDDINAFIKIYNCCVNLTVMNIKFKPKKKIFGCI